MCGVTTDVRPTNLRVGYRSEPLDVSPEDGPRFAWSVSDRSWGTHQTSYRIRLDDSLEHLEDGPVLWDSGRIESNRSVDVPYAGPALDGDTSYHWTVRVWNDAGERSEPAEPATFTTAPAGAWNGAWIGRQPGTGDSNGFRSRWRDPDDDPTEWVQVDLGATQSIGAVELHPAEPFTDTKTPDSRTISANDTEAEYRDATLADGPVAFGFPDRYRIEVADEPSFVNARTIVDATDEDVPDPRREPVVHDCAVDGARYVRVTATALDAYVPDDDRLREDFDPWAVFALAALAVRPADAGDADARPAHDDLARDRSVSASSSVETEAWGADRLTDGEYVSTMTGTSPLFRTEFDVSKPVATARARFVGLGYGELYLNGDVVHDDVLNPGWTQYDERVLYSTYDVTDALDVGRNAVGIWLGRGWFARSLRQWQAFGSPRARLELSIEYEDGTTDRITTGGDWRTAASPIVENDIYDGETFDARRQQQGWADAGFDDGDWESAAVVDAPAGDLSPQRTDPIRVVDTLEPVAIYDHDDGPIVDFGQNHTGWLSIDDECAERGDEIVLRHAEALDADGGLRTVDLRTAEATDRYVAAGEGSVTYEPRFTYHGYRYAQISGYPGELTADDVRSRVVHTDLGSAGTFECSNDDLAGVQHNARWGLLTNAHSVPTDCPQRDERMGFTGDGHVAARAMHYNFDAVRFQEKWFDDHLDTQSEHGYVPTKCPNGSLPGVEVPSWTVSFLAVPWHCYRFYGDESVIREHYAALRCYVEFWESEAVDDLLPSDHEGYGDWLALENADGRFGEPTNFFTNAYYHRSVDLLAKMADAIGLEAQASHYETRAEAIAAAFNVRFFDVEAATYVDRTQATYALPVFFGITPDEHVEDVVTNLAAKVRNEDDGQLRTGFLGTRPLLAVLTEHGHADLAYEVASQPEFPGWVYMRRRGATTVWERWDSDSEEHVGGRMNSLNHSPFTCVSEYFYEHLAGIDVRFEGGQYPVEIKPAFVDGLSWVEGSVETPLGTVESHWEAIDGGYELTVGIPWNVDAEVALSVEADQSVTVDGETVSADGSIGSPAAVDGVTREDDLIAFDLVSGEYVIRIE